MAKAKNGKLRRKDGVWDPLKTSSADKRRAEAVPKTPQSLSPSYRLAYADEDFLCREELRPIRLQLELLKPEMILTERNIKSTVVMFGGARIPAPGQAASPALADDFCAFAADALPLLEWGWGALADAR